MDLKKPIIDILNKCPGVYKTNYGYAYSFYASCDDKMDQSTALGICESDDPYEAFNGFINGIYNEAENNAVYELKAYIVNELNKSGISSPEDEITDLIYDLVEFKYPSWHYLQQMFNVDIIIDTGDGDYDFTKNRLDENNDIHPSSSLLWLAKQQGYPKSRLIEALSEKKSPTFSDSFLCSCAEEVNELATSSNAVTFLTKMSLKNLMDLNIAMRDEKCKEGVLELDNDTVTGLFDVWNGAGGPFDIELNRNVKIPIKYIFSALPDGKVKEVYGFYDDIYEEHCVGIDLSCK